MASDAYSQEITTDKALSTNDLSLLLKPEIIKSWGANGTMSQSELAGYFRKKFSERYFYDWKNFESRFSIYKALYPNAEKNHTERALDHATVFWKHFVLVIAF